MSWIWFLISFRSIRQLNWLFCPYYLLNLFYALEYLSLLNLNYSFKLFDFFQFGLHISCRQHCSKQSGGWLLIGARFSGSPLQLLRCKERKLGGDGPRNLRSPETQKCPFEEGKKVNYFERKICNNRWHVFGQKRDVNSTNVVHFFNLIRLARTPFISPPAYPQPFSTRRNATKRKVWRAWSWLATTLAEVPLVIGQQRVLIFWVFELFLRHRLILHSALILSKLESFLWKLIEHFTLRLKEKKPLILSW